MPEPRVKVEIMGNSSIIKLIVKIPIGVYNTFAKTGDEVGQLNPV
jgi:hypothetical protein